MYRSGSQQRSRDFATDFGRYSRGTRPSRTMHCERMLARKYRKMNVPSVSLIVPCHNEKHYIEPCIQSLLAQNLPSGSFEIIVADALSNDGTREILARLATEHACLRLIDDPGRIVPMGLNTAIRAARSRIIVRIDAHTQYAPDYVRQCKIGRAHV